MLPFFFVCEGFLGTFVSELTMNNERYFEIIVRNKENMSNYTSCPKRYAAAVQLYVTLQHHLLRHHYYRLVAQITPNFYGVSLKLPKMYIFYRPSNLERNARCSNGPYHDET